MNKPIYECITLTSQNTERIGNYGEIMNSTALVYQAKSFYNAFIALEQLSNSDPDWQLLLFSPLIVNGTFAIELTLKAILAKNEINYEKEHNLLVLYQMLPKEFQYELFSYLVEKAPKYRDSKRCIDKLVLLSNAFVDWRYVFEGRHVPAIDLRFLSAFSNAAVCTMFSHYNAYLTTVEKTESDDEIEQKFCNNREICKEINLKMIQKETKRRSSLKE